MVQAPTELFIHGRKRFEDAEWEGFQSVVPRGDESSGCAHSAEFRA